MFSEVPTFNPTLPNGISSFIEAVSQELVKLGHEVHIFEPSLFTGQKKRIKMKENLIKHNLFSVGIGGYKGFRTSFPLGTVFKRMKEKFHVIHAHGPVVGVAASTLAWKQKCVKIVTYHTPGEHYSHYAPRFLPIRYNTIVDMLERLVYSSFDLMLTPADAIRKDLINRGFGAHKLFVLPNCVNLEENHKRISEERMQGLRDQYKLNGKKIVLYVGRMSPEKRIPDIINLVPRIIKEAPDTHFLMVGKGPYLEQYRELARKKAPKDVTFTGYVSNEELSNFLKMSRLGVIFVDGAQVFDITLLNYWSNHLAVCVRRAGGMGDVVSHSDNGMLFDKPRDAFDHLITLLNDDKLCKKLGNRGYETVRDKYSVEVVTKQMLGYYKLAAEKFQSKEIGALTQFTKLFRRKKAPKKVREN